MLNKVLIYTCPELRNTIHLKIDDTDVDLSSVTSKSLYKALKMVKQTPPFAQKRFQDQFPDVQFDQKKKTREFQCKVLNNIVFMNEKLLKI